MTSHSKASETYLKDKETASRHDATFYGVRNKRDKMAMNLPEWEKLREIASRIKRHTIAHLADYLQQFEENAIRNGIKVHWANDAEEYNRIVYDILLSHGVSKVVKSKSMLTEECHLNQSLESKGIEVIETDLGERILQMMHLAPSHIVMPALHVHREDIGDCFREQIPGTKDDNDPTYLTYVARMHLRKQFAEAGVGMTGANFGIASTGEVVVCTNEGNADMSTALPPLHIVSMGIEKIIPDYKSMAVFQRLLARSATGQETTTFTSHFRGPNPGKEMHIILVDNGRSDILANPEHWQTLKCMRCGACMNTCPVYRRSAGYSYSYFIPGPIGINLGMLKDPQKYSGNVSACSLCCTCENICPVKVDLSTQIYRWRQELDSLGKADPMKKSLSKGMNFLFNHPALYRNTLKMASIANWIPTDIGLNPWAYGHKMMHFPKKSFHELWKEKKV